MKLTIKTISGKVYQLEDAEAGLTVEKLKILTEKHTEIEPDCQRLIFKGKVLKNEQTLANAKLSDGDCIIVVKSRKNKKKSSPVENPEVKRESTSEPQATANTNPVQPNSNQASGFMLDQGQPPVANFQALGALFMPNGQANPSNYQTHPAAANAQQSATAASNTNAPSAANPFGAMPFAAMMGQRANGQMPNLNGNAMMQMLQNPMMQEMIRNPAIQQMMQNVMQNPQLLQNMMRNNPMFAGYMQNMGNNGFSPSAATGTPVSVATNGTASQASAAQPVVNNPVSANAVPDAVPPVNANMPSAGSSGQPAQANPQAAQPNPLAFLLANFNNQQPNNANLQNPFQGFQNAPQFRQPQTLNDTQAREMYAAQLEQLKNMGFLDEERNLRALRETAGSVEAAINRLLM